MTSGSEGGTACVRVERSGPQWETRAETSATPRILAVDDEPMILGLIRRILQSAGFEVDTAESECQAVEAARRNGGVHVAILDWSMPETSGERIMDQLTAICPGLRVIVASAEEMSDVERAFNGRNVDCFITKPFEPQSVLAAVKSVLGTG